MKALILSGGLGTRLRPLTNKIPKTMVEIGGRPILWYHIQHLKSHGINHIWLALHWFPEIIMNYFGDGSKYGVKIKYSIERTPLGTAGSLRNPDSSIEKELSKEDLLIVYGDNLTNFDYTALKKSHKLRRAMMSIGLYKSSEPWTMGVIETDMKGKITSFVEKPPKEEIKSDLVSAGVLVCKPEIFKYIPKHVPSDFGFDIFPKLLNIQKPLYALDTGSYVQDCGTLERLSKARIDFENRVVKFNFDL